MKRLITFVVTLLLIAQSHASQSLSDKGDWSLFSDFVSPVTTDAKYIFWGGMASSAMVYSTKRKRDYEHRESFNDAQPFGEFGIVGDVLGEGYLNFLYMLGFYIDGKMSDDLDSLRHAEHMFKATAYTMGWVGSLKVVIDERRPGFPEEHNSFPSGHAAASFSFASVVAARHGWYWGTLAYATAGFIAVSRINDDWHYLHDTLVGATIGASYAWGIQYNYMKGKPYFFSLVPGKHRDSLMGVISYSY